MQKKSAVNISANAKKAIRPPGNIRPANRPPTGRPDFRPRFPVSLSGSPVPALTSSLEKDSGAANWPSHRQSATQTVRPADSPADRPSHKQTARRQLRRAPPSRHKNRTRFVRASGYRIRRGTPRPLSAEITLRPLSWRQPSWRSSPRQPPWRSSARPDLRYRPASSSRPKR